MVGTPENQRPSSDRDFLRLRAQFVRGLVQFARAEPIPAEAMPVGAREMTDEERRALLLDALKGLKAAFADLQEPTPTDARVDTMRAIAPAVEKIVGDRLQEVSAATGDRLKKIAEEAGNAVSTFVNAACPVPKIFIAVHGIGDQFQNETVQLVAHRVCEYVGQPAALPLGRFHAPGVTVTGAFLPDPDRDPPVDCGFAEIYWADVPRIPVKDAHILEDPKKWVRALIERLRLKAPGNDAAAGTARCAKAKREDERLESLLEELIQGIIVADRLVFLADKAGLFKFDLKKLLNDYLNDVQVVTEFEDYRRQLLNIFHNVFTKINKYFYKSEIYIVAHSEGTVVSFMGLLRGLSQNAPWVSKVRGFMTIGSPLNKHVRFWPELFTEFEIPIPPQDWVPIRWKNYYDFGDPIGFDLRPTREWMAKPDKVGRTWTNFFAFRNPRDANKKAADSGDANKKAADSSDDIGFTRYYFPGEAHNEYWKDPDVFGHFIEEVVNKDSKGQLRADGLPRHEKKPFGVPDTVGAARLTSYCLPYALAAALLFLASFLLYKPVRGCLDPIGARFETPLQVLGNVTGLAGVIAAMSLLARIPRLSTGWGWRALAVVLAVFFSFGYLLVSVPNAVSIETFLDTTGGTCRFLSGLGVSPGYLNNYNLGLIGALIAIVFLGISIRGLRPILWTLAPVVFWVLGLRLAGAVWSDKLPPLLAPFRWQGLGMVSVAWVIGVAAAFFSRLYPKFGTKPLVHTGGLLILMIVVTEFVSPPKPAPPSPETQVKTARAVENEVRNALPRLVELPDDPQGKTSARQMIADAAHMRAVADAAPARGPIWPVLVAGAAFLYVWWLAILTFDLTFVWHLYIRWNGAQKYVEGRMEKKK